MSSSVVADENICRLFPNGTIIRDIDSCEGYITCINFESHYTKCPDKTPYFDKETQKCTTSLKADLLSKCGINCVNHTEEFIADPKSCSGWYYCLDDTTYVGGSCEYPYHFDQKLQSCIYDHVSDCKLSTMDFCSIVTSGTKFNDPSSCAKYFQCKSNGLSSETCTNKYYDAFTGDCVEKSLVECEAHPYPKDVCGTKTKPEKNVKVKDGATCRGYFYCAALDSGPDPAPKWYQCETDTFFNPKTQKCDTPTNVPCEWDRCDGRTKTYVSASTYGCRYYARCENGVTVDISTCGNSFL